MPYEESAPEATTWDRIGPAFVAMLLAAFMLTLLSPMIASAGADELSATRDDGSGELLASEEEDDDEDDDPGSESGQASIGSFSGNTATGTTAGTGLSKSVSESGDASAQTATGSTRGTGASQSVSNSS